MVRFLVREDPLEKGMATHSFILAWRILPTGEPGGLQSMGSQRVGHDWSNLVYTHAAWNKHILFSHLHCFLFYTLLLRELTCYHASSVICVWMIPPKPIQRPNQCPCWTLHPGQPRLTSINKTSHLCWHILQVPQISMSSIAHIVPCTPSGLLCLCLLSHLSWATRLHK